MRAGLTRHDLEQLERATRRTIWCIRLAGMGANRFRPASWPRWRCRYSSCRAERTSGALRLPQQKSGRGIWCLVSSRSKSSAYRADVCRLRQCLEVPTSTRSLARFVLLVLYRWKCTYFWVSPAAFIDVHGHLHRKVRERLVHPEPIPSADCASQPAYPWFHSEELTKELLVILEFR